MTKQQVQEARERAGRATGPSWKVSDILDNGIDGIVTNDGFDNQIIIGVPNRLFHDDLTFIAHSRADLPAALDMLERAAKIIEATKATFLPLPDGLEWMREWRGERPQKVDAKTDGGVAK